MEFRSTDRVRVETIHDNRYRKRTLHKLYEEPMTDYLKEPAKQVPVALDCDVVVAGAGVSGLIAAIAAGRMGAKTVLVDRFGELGGNMGPGWWPKGGLEDALHRSLAGGVAGIPRDLLERVKALRTPKVAGMTAGHNNIEAGSIISYLGFCMCDEAGVELLLSTYAADPILADGVVRGLFVEGKSGRTAVRAAVVIDATGDASIAERGGAPMIRHVPPDPEHAMLIRDKCMLPDFPWWNETGLPYLIAGGDDLAGDKRAEGAAYGMIGFKGQYETNSMFQMSAVEKFLRMEAFAAVQAERKSDPQAYLLATAPYIGARGGPCIEGEHVLTIEEAWRGERFTDALFVHSKRREGIKAGYNPNGFQTPYRIMLPKGFDGMLVTGRGASYIRRGHDGTGNRSRMSLMALGQAAGIAAAVAVADGTTPKTLDSKRVQDEMMRAGFQIYPTQA